MVDSGTVLESEEKQGSFTSSFRRLPGIANNGIVESGAWITLGVIQILWGVRLWLANTTVPVIVIPGVIAVLWGLGIVVWHGGRAASDKSKAQDRVLAISLIVVLVCFLFWAYYQILSIPAYGTDEMAFDQYAAQLFLHGINPYLHSMAPSFRIFQVSPNGYTWMTNGKPVTSLSYPALSFLVYIPFLALGISSQLAVWVNTAAWALSIVLAYLLVPRSTRPYVLVLASLSVYISYAVGGVTDALYLPFLIVVAFTWERFIYSSSRWRYLIPVLFGLSMSIKQTSWLVLPFLAFAVVWESKSKFNSYRLGLTTGIWFVSVTLLAFLISNLPFDVTSFIAWLKGITTPLLARTVPNGQGLISLPLFLHFGGGSLFSFTLLGGIAYIALFAIFVYRYQQFKGWIFVIASVPLALTSRSFGSYLVMLAIPGLVAITNMKVQQSVAKVGRRGKVLLGGALVLVGVVATYALTRSSPLQMIVSKVHTSGQLATVDQVAVKVSNVSGSALTPKFTADEGGSLTAFWQVLQGPASLKPGQSSSYLLAAPNFYAMPALTGGFQIVAFTSSGGVAISHSGSYIPALWHLALTPDAINHSVPYGTKIVIKAQILDRYDRPVHADHVSVYMGQIIYAQRGLIYGQATINNGNVGQTPIMALTNSQGVATFTITDTVKESDPVYFEANLEDNVNFYPYGYSQIVPIRFK